MRYFEMDEIAKAMYRRKLARNLEDMYLHLSSTDQFDGTLIDFIDQTEQDMILIENYESAAALKELRIQKGWNY